MGESESQAKITVHGGWDAFGVADFSPACLKLKTYLRMNKVPYTSTLGDPRKAPTKKIPYITDGDATIGDSGLIIEHVKKKFGDRLDANLTEEQRAIGHVVRRTCEESLYWPVLQTRWSGEDSWPKLAEQFKTIVPPVIGGLILNMIRKDTLRNAWGQGISRHTPENVIAHAKADIDALSALLGDKKYLFGDAPTSYDASLFGTMANTIAFPENGPISKHAKSKKNLVSFVDRVKQEYWATAEDKVAPKK
jgi:glutathione S-transferase